MSKADDRKLPSPAELPPPSMSPSFNWRERVILPSILAGIAGGGYGLISKHRKVHGAANISATYATNFAIVAGCYCGAREFVRVTRKSDPDDLLNSAIGGFSCGALLGRLQGGQAGAIKYSVIFAVVGTGFDYTVMKLRPIFATDGWFKLPEWSPIRVLDEEELAAKQAREEKIFAQRGLAKLNNKES